jgi:hypothetical protein
MKSLLDVLVFVFFVAGVLCGLGVFLLSFGIIKNIRPGVRIWGDLKGMPLNAIFSRKYLTEEGVKIRYYLFICLLGFCGSGAAGAMLGFLRSLL